MWSSLYNVGLAVLTCANSVWDLFVYDLPDSIAWLFGLIGVSGSNLLGVVFTLLGSVGFIALLVKKLIL